MRVLGVDYGRRRIGLAVSDDSATLARPWRTVPAASTPAQTAALVADLIDTESRATLGDFVVGALVVGLPRRLNGQDNDQTAPARLLADALAARLGVPIHLQDERLTSVEAEALLAEREPDWRERKKKLDAAAAAIILQDYLDARRPQARAADQDPLA